MSPGHARTRPRAAGNDVIVRVYAAGFTPGRKITARICESMYGKSAYDRNAERRGGRRLPATAGCYQPVGVSAVLITATVREGKICAFRGYLDTAAMSEAYRAAPVKRAANG